MVVVRGELILMTKGSFLPHRAVILCHYVKIRILFEIRNLWRCVKNRHQFLNAL